MKQNLSKALHDKVLHGDIAHLKFLLSNADCRGLNWNYWNGEAPLHLAAALGHDDMIVMLCQAGIGVNHITNDW